MSHAGIQQLRNEQRDKHQNCFVLGFTGETGKELATELATSKIYERVVLIGRRQVEYPAGDLRSQLEQRIIDFDNIDQHIFTGLHVGFCALGTTQSKAGKDGFYKVDHDYVVAAATAARQAECNDFHLVTSMGADENSWFFYTKTKGQVERDLSNLKLSRFTVYRPGMLLCDRQEARPVELVAQKICNVIGKCTNLGSVPTPTLARAMVNASVVPFPVADRCRNLNYGENVEVLENADIHEVAARV